MNQKLWAVLAIGFLTASSNARADDEKLRHVLGGHAFLPTLTFPSAFAESRVTLLTGLVTGTNELTFRSGITRDLKLGALAPAVEGQIAFGKGWAVNLLFRGNVIAGLNTESALLYGASTSYVFNLGLLYEIIRAEKLVFTAAFDVARPHRLAISPGLSLIEFFESTVTAIQERAERLDTDFVKGTTETQWKPSLRYTYAFNEKFGFRSLLGVNFLSFEEEEVSPDTSSTRAQLGLALEADFNTIIDLPVALSINYSRGQILTQGAPNTDTLTFGIFEAGPRRFDAGFEIGKIWTEETNSWVFGFLLRGYFN